MIRTLENRFYYLDNFQMVVDWIGERYDVLLDDAERSFVRRFPALPQPARALLVRMVMRKGELFRSGKLQYEEIGDTQEAAEALLAEGWIDERPSLTLEQIFALLTKTEIATVFREALPKGAAKKADLLEALRVTYPEARAFDEWHAAACERVYALRIAQLCDRLRLMFFGNLHQDWTEFVLSDLGIFRYEKVDFPASAQAFRIRRDVDDYLHLHHCRERFENGDAVDDVLADIPFDPMGNRWLEQRRAKLLFHIAQHLERVEDWRKALDLYSRCCYPGARIRRVRVFELSGETEAALTLAEAARAAPESEAELQQLLRMMPRLQRKLGGPKAAPRKPVEPERIDLFLALPTTPYSVEELVRAHLSQPDAPAFYVENTLINSLFGLLCWKAVFAAVPGAFFHPFHTGPADLHSADFHQRREAEFSDCLSALSSEHYKDIIRMHFREKAGIQSPFVAWSVLTEELLEFALACIPAQHLACFFRRILQDIRANRSGMPDLIQFWPGEQRYRMIEVKAPGDRLRDNQLRWLDHFAAHNVPVAVCYVQWQEQIP